MACRCPWRSSSRSMSPAPRRCSIRPDELVEIGNEGASLRLVAAQRPGRQLTVLHERYEPGCRHRRGHALASRRGGRRGGARQGRAHRGWADARARSRRCLLFRKRDAASLSQCGYAKSVRSSRPPPRRRSETQPHAATNHCFRSPMARTRRRPEAAFPGVHRRSIRLRREWRHFRQHQSGHRPFAGRRRRG